MQMHCKAHAPEILPRYTPNVAENCQQMFHFMYFDMFSYFLYCPTICGDVPNRGYPTCMLERLIRLLLGIFVGRVPVLDRCLTAMQCMIACVYRETPALLTRGITQFGTIARVLFVPPSSYRVYNCYTSLPYPTPTRPSDCYAVTFLS